MFGKKNIECIKKQLAKLESKRVELELQYHILQTSEDLKMFGGMCWKDMVHHLVNQGCEFEEILWRVKGFVEASDYDGYFVMDSSVRGCYASAVKAKQREENN